MTFEWLDWGPQAQAALALCLGLILGSFCNVCIHRLPERLSVVWPGSRCPGCGAPILWHDNFPLVSWLWLRGRCRRCAASISIRYPLVEAAAAALLLGLWLQHGLTPRWAALCWLALSVLVLVPIDWRHGILPDRVTLTGLAVGLLASPFTLHPGVAGALAGAVVGGAVPLSIRALYSIWARVRAARAAPTPVAVGVEGGVEPPEDSEGRHEGMGLGDVKMLAMVGAYLGPAHVFLTMLLGSVLGTLYVLPLLAAGRHGMKSPVPFGPFLGVATLVSMFWGERIIAWYLGS